MKIERLRPEFVDMFPTAPDAGVFYVSIEFGTCMHLCACGCGQEVVTPLSPAQWSITYDGHNISLWPSVGNWTLPCRSHYVLDRGRVHPARQFSPIEIARNRTQDRFALKYDEWTGSDDGPLDIPDASHKPEGKQQHSTRWDRLRRRLWRQE
ncbi:DUF6527 family protein [Antrihabitans sp. YC2-6]|uniref:DUF6527 family protein n=1 Tax=Antrihabitans sp. YC2-6 TaxID=2799498 RepID=UPI0018F70701|nr:DUF6527 family protein [Antrihabitans sp. YC2-6]MBJ8348661.1 hypothetical protein [Antrihabitans sp. YC2-6]